MAKKINKALQSELDLFAYNPIKLPPDYLPTGEIQLIMSDGTKEKLDNYIKFQLGIDKVAEYIGRPPSIAFPELLDELRNYYGATILEEKPPVPYHGKDIIRIRELTGKKRDAAMKELNDQALAMYNAADKDCFFIPTNVASSKNNKEIGRFKKRNKVTGELEEFSTLVNSKITEKYKKTTAQYWVLNKVAFLNMTRHMPIPLQIEFTFIRDSLRGFDLVNASQVILDLMGTKHGYGWIPDDESCYIVPVFNKYVFYHQKLAGVLIRVIK